MVSGRELMNRIRENGTLLDSFIICENNINVYLSLDYHVSNL